MAGRDFNDIENNFGDNVRYTREYQTFKDSEVEMPETLYERIAKKLWEIYEIPFSSLPGLSRLVDGYAENIEVSRMEIEADQIGSLLLLPLLFMVPVALTASLLVGGPIALFTWIFPGFWTYWVLSYPDFRSTVVRIKSSDEALRVVLYMAMQLEMNPNLSQSVKSAAGHTNGYLSRDLAKVMWETETKQKTVQNIRQAISNRIDLWRKWSPSFVKSLEYLIDSLSRNGDDRRRMIEKGQEKIIGDMENQMDEYARDLTSPIRVLNMAGIMLPLMGLIMFPLISVFLGGDKVGVGGISVYMGFVYLIILPLFLYFLVKRLISKRPGAYSHPSLEHVDNLPPKDKVRVSFSGKTYEIPLVPLAFIVGLLVALPGIIYYFNLLNTIVSFETGIELTGGQVQTPDQWKDFINNQYDVDNAVPNVVQAMSLFWGVNAGLVTYFLGRSYGRQKIRKKIEKIEEDIEIGLTELENALSKGMPIERAMYTVTEKFDEIGESDKPLEEFFEKILDNMEQKGFPFERAVFDDNEGAIQNYPSNILRNAMNMLADSSAKGPNIAAENLRRVNDYIKNQKKVEETIRRLLDETVSQMQIQAKFIAPVITGAAGAMSLLIVQTLYIIAERLRELQESLMVGQQSNSGGFADQIALIKNLDSALPPTLILLIVSLYLVEVSLILGYFMNGIENGFDEISRDMQISKTLIYSTTVFSLIVIISALVVMPLVPGIIE
jgi:hypothetical protein